MIQYEGLGKNTPPLIISHLNGGRWGMRNHCLNEYNNTLNSIHLGLKISDY